VQNSQPTPAGTTCSEVSKYIFGECTGLSRVRLVTQADLAREFTALVRRQGTGLRLDAWIERARHAGYSELRGFAAGLIGDRNAVVAGLIQSWNSGPVEGHANRIKTIKRQMYGRANLDLSP
jgi:transposase